MPRAGGPLGAAARAGLRVQGHAGIRDACRGRGRRDEPRLPARHRPAARRAGPGRDAEAPRREPRPRARASAGRAHRGPQGLAPRGDGRAHRGGLRRVLPGQRAASRSGDVAPGDALCLDIRLHGVAAAAGQRARRRRRGARGRGRHAPGARAHPGRRRDCRGAHDPRAHGGDGRTRAPRPPLGRRLGGARRGSQGERREAHLRRGREPPPPLRPRHLRLRHAVQPHPAAARSVGPRPAAARAGRWNHRCRLLGPHAGRRRREAGALRRGRARGDRARAAAPPHPAMGPGIRALARRYPGCGHIPRGPHPGRGRRKPRTRRERRCLSLRSGAPVARRAWRAREPGQEHALPGAGAHRPRDPHAGGRPYRIRRLRAARSSYPETAMSNPLLDFSSLPHFSRIEPGHVGPAVDRLIATGRATIERLAARDARPTWDTFVEPLDDANEKLARAWTQVSYLNAVVNTPELRDAYNAALPKVTEFFTEQGQDQRLYAGFKALAATPGFESWPAARRRFVELQLRDFRLGGAELPPPQKARFLEIQAELARLGSQFQDNVLDATNAFELLIEDESELSGIPADVKQAAREAAAKEGRPGWKLTLQMPCYLPVMQYADHHGLRERMYRAYLTRASELGADPKWDNTGVIRQLLALRGEEAKLLGYGSFAEVSLATKMAG